MKSCPTVYISNIVWIYILQYYLNIPSIRLLSYFFESFARFNCIQHADDVFTSDWLPYLAFLKTNSPYQVQFPYDISLICDNLCAPRTAWQRLLVFVLYYHVMCSCKCFSWDRVLFESLPLWSTLTILL